MENQEVHYAYCSACDQEVPVVLQEKPSAGVTPAPRDAESLVCLAYGEKCTGNMCPLFDVPSDQMRENLEKSGRQPAEGRRPEQRN